MSLYSRVKKPSLPVKLMRPSIFYSTLFILYSIGMFIIPGVAARTIVASELLTPVKVPLIIVLMFFSQQGLHLLGLVAHEGSHLSLFPNKHANYLSGIFFSSIIPGYMETGQAMIHSLHHKYINRDGDPDLELYSNYNCFWKRLLMSRLAVMARNNYLTISLALGRTLPPEQRLPFKRETSRRFAWFNIISTAFWLLVYFTIAIINPLTFVIVVLMPCLFAIPNGLRYYVEHAGTDRNIFRQARTRTSWLDSLLFFFVNYHLEHHLYPSVPCYRLPEVHRILQQEGLLESERSPIEKNFFRSFAFVNAELS